MIIQIISDIVIFDHIGLDTKICWPYLSDSCSNSDDGQTSTIVGDDSGNNDSDDGCSGGYDDKDCDNEEWAVWYENYHYFCTIAFRA
jgi:hypothetical protein